MGGSTKNARELAASIDESQPIGRERQTVLRITVTELVILSVGTQQLGGHKTLSRKPDDQWDAAGRV